MARRGRKGAVALVAAAMALGTTGRDDDACPSSSSPAQKKLELRCISDQRELQVPVPERWLVKRAVVHLRYTVSANLVPESSTLVVKLRHQPIAQARLNPQAPEVKLGVQIPNNLLEPGYNPLTLAVTQHASKNQCESPCTPDLWTNVSLRDSYVEIEYDLKPLPRELSALSTHVFDPRLMPEGRYIVTADSSIGNATLAGIVASGVARRFDYRRVTSPCRARLKPGVDNVLVGSRDFVRRLLSDSRPPRRSRIKGGYLKLLPMDAADGSADPTRALLVISGEDEAAARLAAITFSTSASASPGSDELKAFAFTMPDVPNTAAARPSPPTRPTSSRRSTSPRRAGWD